MYSSIKRKACKHKGCNKMPQLSCAGYCWEHCPEEIKLKFKSKKDLQRKAANARKYANTKLRMANYKENTELELWFRSAALELSKHPYCEECGAYIPQEFYRAATAHILPKKKEYGFPSVATHPLNKLFLGAGCGCHNKSHRWDTFSKMKVWEKAVANFLEIYRHIHNDEIKNIPEVLLVELKKNLNSD